MDVVRNRRKNLQQWIDKKFNGIQADFVKETGINQGELSGLLREKSFGEKKARSLEKIANIPIGWLDKNHNEPEPNLDNVMIPVAAVEEYDGDMSPYCEVDVYDIKLSAGNGTQFTWYIREDEPLMFRRAWFKRLGYNRDSIKALYVRGDSMEPLIKNWDTILIDTDDTELASGEVYAVIYKGKQFIKEVQIKPDSVLLLSLNPKYDPINIPESDCDKFQVLGRMIWRGG